MEHALVFASIIVGVAVSDQIMSLNRLLVARRQVRWDWPPLVLALLVVLTNVQVWWSVAAASDGRVTIGAFLPILVELVLLALLSAATLPGAEDEERLDLRAYYERHARYLWTLYALTLGWAIVSGVIELAPETGWAGAIRARSSDLIPLAVMGSLIFVRRRWWLALCCVLLSAGPLGWLSRSLS